jgi:hypothetical protein
MVLHSFRLSCVCIMILAHTWDAFGFLCKIGCDNSSLRPFPVAGLPPNLLPRPRESFLSHPFLCPGRDLTEVKLTPVAAAVRPLQRPHRSKLRPKSSQGTPLVALRPCPAGPGRRNLAGPPPDGARGLQCKVSILPEGLSKNRRYSCKNLKLLRALSQKWISNSTCDLLNLVNSVENSRKIVKTQTQFCWIHCEKYYNFCYSCLSCFPDNLCMKNRNVKNLDLRYLQIYKSYIANFRRCCVLCYV